MTNKRPAGGRRLVVCVLALSAFVVGATGAARAADGEFPFGQELLLDAAPMRPAKRVPSLTVAADGQATVDLWCRSVAARVEFADASIKIVAEPLPEALPQMMSEGQCTPARMQADEDLLAALSQVTAWRPQGNAIVLTGAKMLHFMPSTH